MKEAAIKECLKELAETLSSYEAGGADKGDSLGIYESDAGDLAIGEYLAQLRLRMKYLVFDLEATRRENRYLRQMLDVNRRRRTDEDKDGLSGW